jgi:hypothetical protein
MHFIHIRSKHENALPMIVTRWPGSVIEQLKIIEPLTNPTAHGASSGRLPFGNSVVAWLRLLRQADKPVNLIAKAWATLMHVWLHTVRGAGGIGQRHFRGDALQQPPGLLAFTPTWPPPFPPMCRRSRLRPAAGCPPEENTRGINSTTSTRTGWATRSR